MKDSRSFKYNIFLSFLIGAGYGLLVGIAEAIWHGFSSSRMYLLSVIVNIVAYSLASVIFCFIYHFIISTIKILRTNFLALHISFLLSLTSFIVSLIYIYPRILHLSFINSNPIKAGIALLTGFFLLFFLLSFILAKIKHKFAFIYFLILIYIGFLFGGLLRQFINIKNMNISVSNEKEKKQNIIIIVNDSLRSDHLSCNGYKNTTSPFLDSLAKDGILFSRVITQGADTSTSMPCLFTSFYPDESFEALFRKDRNTLGQILKERGYVTAAFSANPFISPEFGFAQGFDLFFNFTHSEKYDIFLMDLLAKILPYLNIISDAGAYYGTMADMNLKIEQFLELNGEKPFFIYVHTMDTHIPYLPPTKYLKRFIDDYDKGYVGDYNLIKMTRQEPNWEEVLLNLKMRYDASIFYLDECINGLWNILERHNLQNDTMLVITADHGDEHNEHGKLFHGGDLYEEIIKVPLIIYHPKILPKGQRISEMVAHIDIIPTVLDILKLPSEDNIKGLSLMPLILRKTSLLPRDFVYSQAEKKVGVIGRRWKYIATLNDKDDIEAIEVYDLLKDPMEKNNLALSTLDIKSTMHKELMSFLQHRKQSQFDTNNLVPELREQLKALGYIQD